MVKVLDSRLLATSWKIEFFEDTLELSSGGTQRTPRWLIPDFVMAVAVRSSDGKIPLVNQYRHGSGKMTWEFPAGHIEPNEKLAACAKREFREEVGFELLKPKLVCSTYTSAPRTNQRAHIFTGYVGRELEQELDDTEELSVKFVAPNTARRLLTTNSSSTHLLAFLLAREKCLF